MSKNQDPTASFNGFLDSISGTLEADIQQNVQEREKRGLEAASDTLKTTLEAAAQGDRRRVRDARAYERDLRKHYDIEDYDTYRGILWAFYELAAAALDEIAMRKGWSFLADLIAAYSREMPTTSPS